MSTTRFFSLFPVLRRLLAGALLLAAAASHASPAAWPEGLHIGPALALDRLAVRERSIAPRDPLAEQLARGGFPAPSAGATVAAEDGSPRAWRPVQLDAEGRLVDAGVADGGYLHLRLYSQRAQVVLLAASGSVWIWHEGHRRPGDVYAFGTWRLPLALKAGANTLLVRGGRGELRLTFTAAPDTPFIETQDATLPDLVEGSAPAEQLAAVVLLNPTPRWTPPLTLQLRMPGGATRAQPVPPLPPLGLRRQPLAFATPTVPPHAQAPQGLPLHLTLQDAGGRVLDERPLPLAVKSAAEPRRVTFRSRLDDSVQYYGLNPAQPGAAPRGLVLSLHGANVEALDLAAAYRPLAFADLVTPTNRQRFGFNWEEWGRLDLLEVLEHARAALQPDPARLWLTGHSMGGHGTWINGTLLADRFAAIAPVAGWSTVWSYAGAPRPAADQPVERIVRRGGQASDTVALLGNLQGLGVYAKHPGEDETVPPAESAALVQALRQAPAPHPDLVWEQRPGIGHWPDNSVVDWPPLLAFLQARTRTPDALRTQFEFTTPDPAASHRMAWIEVHAQQQALVLTRVRARLDRAAARIELDTDNAAALRLDLAALPALPRPAAVHIDGQVLPLPDAEAMWLARDAQGRWSATAPWPLTRKHPARGSRIPGAWRHGVVYVVGTGGNAAENQALLRLAQFHVDSASYQARAAIRLLTDRQYLAERRSGALAGRNVVLFGHAGHNAAWRPLLAGSPVQVSKGRVRAGPHEAQGDDLVAVFLRPQPGSDSTSVVAVAPTGAPAMRAAELVPLLGTGVGFPDWVVFGADWLHRGWDGLRGAGFFDNDWRYDAAAADWRSKAGTAIRTPLSAACRTTRPKLQRTAYRANRAVELPECA